MPRRPSLGLGRRPPGSVAVASGVVLLLLAILGLIFRTPAGVALGLRAPSSGSIEVQSVPAGVNVRLDGVYRGRAPLRMEGVRAGTRRLDLRAEGYLPVAKEVEVSGGETARIEVELLSTQAASGVASTTAPEKPSSPAGNPRVPDARLDPHVANARSQEAANPPQSTAARAHGTEIPPVASSDRAATAHALEDRVPALTQLSPAEPSPRVRKAPAPEPAFIDPEPIATNPPPSRPASKLGTLVVYTVPWSLVFIDGRDTGRTTPLVAYPLAAGSHELRLQAATGQVHLEHIDIAAGQTVRVTKRF